MKMKMTEISEDKFDIYVYCADRASTNSSELVPL
jgi:hypothetical protein